MSDFRDKGAWFPISLFAPGRRLALVSLLLSAAAAAILLARPELRVDHAPWADRVALALVVVGIIGGFIHGIGFAPARHLSRLAADPRFSWPAMVLGLAWLIWRNH